MRVLDGLRDVRLAVEPLLECLVARIVVLAQLQRYARAVGAARAVDLAHSAFAEHALHRVLADGCSDLWILVWLVVHGASVLSALVSGWSGGATQRSI